MKVLISAAIDITSVVITIATEAGGIKAAMKDDAIVIDFSA